MVANPDSWVAALVYVGGWVDGWMDPEACLALRFAAFERWLRLTGLVRSVISWSMNRVIVAGCLSQGWETISISNRVGAFGWYGHGLQKCSYD